MPKPLSTWERDGFVPKATRKGSHVHGFATNHQGDWAPARHSNEYRNNFDKIKWNKEKK